MTTHDTSKSYSISQVCAEFGITYRTARFYEIRGLITPARIGNGNVRVYREADRERLREIVARRAQGFTVNEIKLALDGKGFGKAEIAGQIEFLRKQREEIDQAIADLTEQAAA
jgi:DNA-binding transcriptional MerR regulator